MKDTLWFSILCHFRARHRLLKVCQDATRRQATEKTLLTLSSIHLPIRLQYQCFREAVLYRPSNIRRTVRRCWHFQYGCRIWNRYSSISRHIRQIFLQALVYLGHGNINCCRSCHVSQRWKSKEEQGKRRKSRQWNRTFGEERRIFCGKRAGQNRLIMRKARPVKKGYSE